MKKHRIILITVWVVLALGFVAPQFAQEASPDAEKAEQQTRIEGLNLVNE